MKNWDKIGEETAYDGWRKIIHKKFRLPDGKEAVFDVIGNNDFVTVAAVTPEREFILVQQFRPGPEAVLASFAEGFIDRGETPEQAAARELLEETGYQAEEVIFLKKFRSAYSTETRYCMLATGCVRVTGQKLDPNEFIDVLKLDLAAFVDYLCRQESTPFTNTGSAFLALNQLGWLSLSTDEIQ